MLHVRSLHISGTQRASYLLFASVLVTSYMSRRIMKYVHDPRTGLIIELEIPSTERSDPPVMGVSPCYIRALCSATVGRDVGGGPSQRLPSNQGLSTLSKKRGECSEWSFRVFTLRFVVLRRPACQSVCPGLVARPSHLDAVFVPRDVSRHGSAAHADVTG